VEVTEETLRARRAAGGGRARSYCDAALRRAVEAVRGAKEGDRNAALNREALAVLRLAAGGHLDAGWVQSELRAAALTAGLDASEIDRTLASAWRAAQAQPRNPPPKVTSPTHIRPAPEAAPEAVEATAPPPACAAWAREELTELGNAVRLVEKHGADLRYCAERGEWLVWDGRRWAPDATEEARRRAVDAASDIFDAARRAAVAGDARAKALGQHAVRSQSRKYIDDTANLARTLVPARAADFDADPMVLNVANGTLDLRSGTLRPHRREDRLTKLAPVAFDPEARSDLLDRFLDEATGGDQEFLAFLRRLAGYTLTGSTAEECFAFVHGPPGSCKSTLLEGLKATMGDYATTASFETFLKRGPGGAGSASEDIARLAGARLVVAIETDRDRKWAEGLVNQLTGGDKVAARHLYRATFEYHPQLKLWLAANHAPRVTADKMDGIWRRLHRLPFNRKIPADKRDPKVKATLTDPAVSGSAWLAWAFRGCLDWQREGLRVPQCVRDATEAYRQENDPLAEFFAARCTFAAGARVANKVLREAYEAWHREHGSGDPVSPREFARLLRARLVDEHEAGWKAEIRVKLPKSNAVRDGWRGVDVLDAATAENATPDGSGVVACSAQNGGLATREKI
jgi:putative DNA primase/helicase